MHEFQVMKVLLYGINYSPELTGIGKYSGEMADWLVEQGHEVRVITAPPYYPDWEVIKSYSRFSYSQEQMRGVTVWRCPLYVPKVPSALRRILHLISFSLSSFWVTLFQARWKPDLILYVVPTLFCCPQVLLLKRLTGAHCVIHIQDFEVDALFASGLTKAGLLSKSVSKLERVIYNFFDTVSTISTGMVERARTKGVVAEKLSLFPNWSDIDRFEDVGRDPHFLRELGVNPRKTIILYSGNFGEKQGLEIIVEVAKLFSDRDDLHFLLVGNGAAESRLKAMVKKSELDNVTFADLQPEGRLPSLLASADLHLVTQKADIADMVMPSKLTNILAVGGNAVITAKEDTTLGRLCSQYDGIALCVPPEDVSSLKNGIDEILQWPRKNEVAREYAVQYLDKKLVMDRFFNNLKCSD